MKNHKLFIKINYHIMLFLHLFLPIDEYDLRLKSSYFEVEKCPKCYGTDICDLLITDKYVSNIKVLNIFSSIYTTKNVLHCEYSNKRIVLKKLGSQIDLFQLDSLQNMDYNISIIKENIKKSLMLKLIDENEHNFSLQLCPTIDKFEYIIETIRNKNNITNKNSTDYFIFLYNMYTTLYINPEPIILQILNNKKFPITLHLGCCGRACLQAYMGKTMEKFYSSNWKTRANITLQLLKAAHTFTFEHEFFRIYLTDISMDNIAISETGKVSYIDLEHVLLVDKRSEANNDKWHTNHTSENLDCKNRRCFAFSPLDICSHNISDHNIYMTCEMLLNESTNFLHDIPQKIQVTFPNVMEILQNCVYPVNKSRFQISSEIIEVLEKSIQIIS